MKTFLSILLLGGLFSLSPALFSQQEAGWCGTDHKMKEYIAANPQLAIDFDNLNQWIAENSEYIMSTSESGEYYIPMVVHVIHNYGTENISDAQIVDAIRILNEDFNKQNMDTVNIVPTFKPIAGNAKFIFRLATKDPNGQCTNGITRTPSLLTYDANDDAKIISWPRAKYYNMWVVSNIYSESATAITAGYATLPSFGAEGTDGILLDDNYVGSIGTSNGSNFNKRVLTHETGHFFNLMHPWGWGEIGSSCTGSDLVNDTPPTKGAFSNCPLTKDECGQLENVQNFMDYASCTNMYTNGQVARMTTAINNSAGQRSSLWKAANLTATGTGNPYTYPAECAPIADFKTNRFSVCAGTSFTLTDQSYNVTPTSWNWTVTDGTHTFNSTTQNPTFTINDPGTYNVTLTVSAPGGNDTKTLNAYIYVYNATADFSSFLYEDNFDNGPITNGRWSNQYDWAPTVGWEETTQASYSAPNALRVNGYNSDKGISYSIISPSYDFSVIDGTPTLTFKYAFARRTNDDNDRLRVYISNSCGQSWNVRWTALGTNLATTTNKTSNWAPASASDWKTITITNLNAWATSDNVRFRFEFNSGGGNNLYLDDINIVGPNVGVEELNTSALTVNIFPNPVQSELTVNFDAPASGTYQIIFSDMTGRTLLTTAEEKATAGAVNYNLTLPQGIAEGMYFLTIQMGGHTTTTKVMIQP
ncbi:MAG: T9SS type A sorting domain-containing protein [Flavobacteriales bacterium]|nr:T9SS type A sorting domain-containing protein [Flavobacteriales bacterium]